MISLDRLKHLFLKPVAQLSTDEIEEIINLSDMDIIDTIEEYYNLDYDLIQILIKRKQAIFFKYLKKQRGGKSQFYGKKSSVMVAVPKSVKNEAIKALKMHKLGFQGGLETGFKRANQLATKAEISIEDIRYMKAWFARHIYASYPTFKKWEDAGKPLNDSSWYRRHGVLSWEIWGGNPAFYWINSEKVVKKLNDYYPKKNYKVLKL